MVTMIRIHVYIMYSIIQFSMKNYSSDSFCKLCFYDFILIVLYSGGCYV